MREVGKAPTLECFTLFQSWGSSHGNFGRISKKTHNETHKKKSLFFLTNYFFELHSLKNRHRNSYFTTFLCNLKHFHFACRSGENLLRENFSLPKCGGKGRGDTHTQEKRHPNQLFVQHSLMHLYILEQPK